jgi:hypothetical protein
MLVLLTRVLQHIWPWFQSASRPHQRFHLIAPHYASSALSHPRPHGHRVPVQHLRRLQDPSPEPRPRTPPPRPPLRRHGRGGVRQGPRLPQRRRRPHSRPPQGPQRHEPR